MNSFLQHLNAPEYMHVLLNPVPVYGLAMGFIALLGGLIWRNCGACVAGLALIVLAGISAWPVYQYGEAGYDRVKSMADSAGDKWLDAHMRRGEQLIYVFYVVAALSAIAIAAELKFPRSAVPLAIATVILAGANLGIGGYIAYAGGHVRHREFRFEPPPVARADEHHPGDEHQHGEQQKHEGSPTDQAEHAAHEAMAHEGASELRKSEEERKQLEASRLQLEASRLQLEASKKQLEAAGSASPSAPAGASSPASPSPEQHHEHQPPR